MRREDIEKLLGGYATDSLTPAEREQLFTAALDDQSLFDELAREDALREALADPAARAQALAALDGRPQSWRSRFTEWLGRPAGMAAMAGTLAAAVAVGVFVHYQTTRLQPALVTQVRPSPATRPDVAPPPAQALPPLAQQAESKAKAAAAEPEQEKPAAAKQAPKDKSRTGRGGSGSGFGPGEAAATGGVIGGVIGGVPPAEPFRSALPPPPPPPPPPAPSPMFARDSAAPPAAPAALPPPPERKAEARKSAVTETNKDLSAAAGAAPAPQTHAPSFAESVTVTAEAPESASTLFNAGAGLRSGDRARQTRRLAAQPGALLASNFGLRYSVLRATPSGAFLDVDPATVFTSGEQVRLVFEANDDGYLYVLQREAGGGWRLLFGDRIKRRVRHEVPARGALAYDEPGVKRLFVLFSRTPERAIARLDPSVIEERVRAGQVMEKGADQSVYIVTRGAVLSAQQVGVSILLTYR
jgi:hypothetical protein